MPSAASFMTLQGKTNKQRSRRAAHAGKKRRAMRTVTQEEMKQIMLAMLVDFDAFCRSHQLRYCLIGGTLLGAVRHHGYIPWDDDVDVAMPRQDYEQFAALYNREKTNPDFTFASYHQIPNLYVSSGKLYDTRTVLKEYCDSDVQIGVYLDIFPLDNIGKTREEAEAFSKEALKYRKRLTRRTWMVNVPGRAWYKNCAVAVLKLFSTHQPVAQLVKEQDDFCSSRRSRELEPYVSIVCDALKPEILEGAWFDTYIEMPFEGHSFFVPSGYDQVLTAMYGNYMQLPPVEQRVTHHSYDVWYRDEEK